MARGKPSPDKQLADLDRDRDGIAAQRNELQQAISELQGSLAAIPDRRREAQASELRGRSHEDTLQQIAADERQAADEITAKQSRVAAAEQVEREIGVEMGELAYEHAAFFLELAERASAEAAAAGRAASAAIDAAAAAARHARTAWDLPRQTAQREGSPMPADFGTADFAGVRMELAKVLRGDPFWPSGRRAGYEAWRRENAKKESPAKLSVREAVARFGGEAA